MFTRHRQWQTRVKTDQRCGTRIPEELTPTEEWGILKWFQNLNGGLFWEKAPHGSQVWWQVPINLALERVRQENKLAWDTQTISQKYKRGKMGGLPPSSIWAVNTLSLRGGVQALLFIYSFTLFVGMSFFVMVLLKSGHFLPIVGTQGMGLPWPLADRSHSSTVTLQHTGQYPQMIIQVEVALQASRHPTAPPHPLTCLHSPQVSSRQYRFIHGVLKVSPEERHLAPR